MTPERMAELVARWVRFYTRDLPTPIAQRRIEEIDADLHDHITHERTHGTSDRRIALGIASRMVRGLAADASWRGRTIEGSPSPKVGRSAHRSAVRVALATACILLVPLLARQMTRPASCSSVACSSSAPSRSRSGPRCAARSA
jgi:hypothetical protein